MFDPVLVNMDATSFSLAGLEVSFEGGRMPEFRRWQCQFSAVRRWARAPA